MVLRTIDCSLGVVRCLTEAGTGSLVDPRSEAGDGVLAELLHDIADHRSTTRTEQYSSTANRQRSRRSPT